VGEREREQRNTYTERRTRSSATHSLALMNALVFIFYIHTPGDHIENEITRQCRITFGRSLASPW
jgi:hypothetical protein